MTPQTDEAMRSLIERLEKESAAEIAAWQLYAHRLVAEFKTRFKNEEVPGDIELLYEKAAAITRARLAQKEKDNG